MRERLFRLIGILLLLGSLVAGWYGYGYQTFVSSPLPIAGDVHFEVRPGSSLKQIAADLAAAGHLEHPHYFIWLARLSGQARQIHAGEYQLEAAMMPRQLLQKMVLGQVHAHALTLVEGWNFRQVLQAVRSNPNLQSTLDENTEAITVMERLGYAGEHPEGRFFPDTYHFPRGMNDVQFLQRAYRRMQDVLDHEWAGRSADLPLKSREEALILASIIEKETGRASERGDVAGVFVRRLKIGMRLQTDPTVIYGLGDRFEGRLRTRDLRTDTPYNTYTRHGLPPTPIAMPGRESIHAALHPADGDSLFFVSRGDGSHQFSATLEEHNRAVRKYQLGK